jgi:hypothetical protein
MALLAGHWEEEHGEEEARERERKREEGGRAPWLRDVLQDLLGLGGSRRW